MTSIRIDCLAVNPIKVFNGKVSVQGNKDCVRKDNNRDRDVRRENREHKFSGNK